ncbi:hypothetical protein NCC78_26945 [Micromonospora phytophila]|uniref:hypothetical protein n=1 Tax=Micromonospora phytophila TaxID=709888 RepID=UPI00203063CF|nr:hypothetical protein [Micromonospora phytophila]MCM0678283.1 hypothetical protein [Micromonospora phytophila]
MTDAGWFPEVSSSASLLISIAAVAFTGLAYRDRRRQDRRDLFLKLHERLVEADLQRGRRLLFTRAQTLESVLQLRDEEPDNFDLINRAIAMLDVAGLYVDRKYVDKQDFLAEWGGVYGRAWLAADAFLAVRLGDLRGGRQGWPYFRALGVEAAAALDPEPAATPASVVPPADA